MKAHGQQAVLEGKLTWLVYMIGAMVGGYSWSDASASDGEEIVDASLARRVFRLAHGLDGRLVRYGWNVSVVFLCLQYVQNFILYIFMLV